VKAISNVRTDSGPTFDVVVIGAGFAGIYMVHRLRTLGFSVQGLEAGAGVGGTWYWNRYPGARCDIESMFYSYSFMEDLDQEWPLTELYPSQPRILEYLQTASKRLDVLDNFRFGARVVALDFDAAANQWSASLQTGERITSRFVVTAVGCLSASNSPDFEGLASFSGTVLHTSNWPEEPVDLVGKRVGVIGTGASGIQAIPVIAAEAEHVTVFQRTPQFTLPAHNAPVSEELERLWKLNYREWRRRSRLDDVGVPYPSSSDSAMAIGSAERRAIYERGWQNGSFSRSFAGILVDETVNETAADFVREKIASIVEDPSIAAALQPHSYPYGTKRTPLNTGYYETFNRNNVDLVDLRAHPIERFTSEGIRTSAGTHELDVVVLATGFDALTGPLVRLGVQANGVRLDEAWSSGAATYLGLMVPEFPNLFTVTGPGSPSVLTNMPVAIEQHVEWIADCLMFLAESGYDYIEARADQAATWMQEVQVAAHKTLYPRASSWYAGANIPGKPRQFLPYAGGLVAYRRVCDEVASAQYASFTLGCRIDRLADPRDKELSHGA
jgi:cyclohexanone monooxygenase